MKVFQAMAFVAGMFCSMVAHGAQDKPSAPTAVSAEPSPEIQKDLEVLALKAQLTQATKQVSDLQAAVGVCQSQLGPLQFEQNKLALQAEQRSIIEKFEKANPGFTLDPATGKSVKKPKS